jgi:hypothetical protein
MNGIAGFESTPRTIQTIPFMKRGAASKNSTTFINPTAIHRRIVVSVKYAAKCLKISDISIDIIGCHERKVTIVHIEKMTAVISIDTEPCSSYCSRRKQKAPRRKNTCNFSSINF